MTLDALVEVAAHGFPVAGRNAVLLEVALQLLATTDQVLFELAGGLAWGIDRDRVLAVGLTLADDGFLAVGLTGTTGVDGFNIAPRAIRTDAFATVALGLSAEPVQLTRGVFVLEQAALLFTEALGRGFVDLGVALALLEIAQCVGAGLRAFAPAPDTRAARARRTRVALLVLAGSLFAVTTGALARRRAFGGLAGLAAGLLGAFAALIAR